ncbi:uncharacterized protein METZ01_LOCUS12050 [marine metagenome]|uniref:Uncharacterized protein n=1 Tax=marine metagenome TaxID=408172 RepID=A0A381NX49_9ZZZZ
MTSTIAESTLLWQATGAKHRSRGRY